MKAPSAAHPARLLFHLLLAGIALFLSACEEPSSPVAGGSGTGTSTVNVRIRLPGGVDAKDLRLGLLFAGSLAPAEPDFLSKSPSATPEEPDTAARVTLALRPVKDTRDPGFYRVDIPDSLEDRHFARVAGPGGEAFAVAVGTPVLFLDRNGDGRPDSLLSFPEDRHLVWVRDAGFLTARARHAEDRPALALGTWSGMAPGVNWVRTRCPPEEGFCSLEPADTAETAAFNGRDFHHLFSAGPFQRLFYFQKEYYDWNFDIVNAFRLSSAVDTLEIGSDLAEGRVRVTRLKSSRCLVDGRKVPCSLKPGYWDLRLRLVLVLRLSAYKGHAALSSRANPCFDSAFRALQAFRTTDLLAPVPAPAPNDSAAARAVPPVFSASPVRVEWGRLPKLICDETYEYRGLEADFRVPDDVPVFFNPAQE